MCVGYPYGTVPRLLLFWMTTEAVRTGSRHLELGDTLASFMRELGLNPATGGGIRGDAKRLRDQMERLFSASISFDYSVEGYQKWINMEVTTEGELWWDPKHPEQITLFSSWVKLGEKFYEAITKYPIPLDMRALRALKKSPLALDLYSWLSYRSFRVSQTQNRKPVFIPWVLLQQQFGADYNDLKDFKKRTKDALRKVLAIYRDLQVEDVLGGVQLAPSQALIAPR